eukprot:TRINITY_DN6409_c0_g2_i1.p1 TRINITY_DN6409_c0_g2~~TRINITY_DN6409_c0_g2_i1.p1  ORF type:complete len:414 (+),score=143.22 TRINITY_DN6409_c0_g2_i1:85-1242(+)
MAAQGEQDGTEVLAIAYTRGSLRLLDQTKLPLVVHYDVIRTAADAWAAIREMRVRGAPAIAISAALGLAVEAVAGLDAADGAYASGAAAAERLRERLEYLGTSRPTAVNLHNAVRDLSRIVADAAASGADAGAVVNSYVEAAEAMLAADEADNRGIAEHGSEHILRHNVPAAASANIVTICNTGALACARIGTALGVIRFVHRKGRLGQVFPLETRPYNQGGRLTVFECVSERIPCTLLVDSAVSYLMQTRSIHACVVGADRVCLNGDFANKIGTYNVAVAAKHHGVPFYVAAPVTTIDQSLHEGSGIPVEQRSAEEITHNMQTKQRIVADGPTLSVWNPAFDVTPHRLVTGGIITELGVITPDADGRIDVPSFLRRHGKWTGGK